MLLKKIFDVILSFFDLVVPDSDNSPVLEAVVNVVGEFIPILQNGISIFRMFLGNGALSIISIFLGTILVLNAFYLTYSLVMWVVSKIPFLGIK